MPLKSKTKTPEQLKEEQEVTEKQYIKDSILYFYEEQQNLKAHQERVELLKQEFYNEMDKNFDKYAGADGTVKVKLENAKTNTSLYCGNVRGVRVTRVVPTKVKIHADKLRRMLDKHNIENRGYVMHEYEVRDVNALLQFLKKEGYKFKKIEKFFKKKYLVNQTAIDNGIMLGDLDAEIVKECIDVSSIKPYYRLTAVKGRKYYKPPVVE